MDPPGIAYDRKTDRIFSGCSKTSVVINATTGKVVAEIAAGWRPATGPPGTPRPNRRGVVHRRRAMNVGQRGIWLGKVRAIDPAA